MSRCQPFILYKWLSFFYFWIEESGIVLFATNLSQDRVCFLECKLNRKRTHLTEVDAVSDTPIEAEASKDITADTVTSNAGGNALLDAEAALSEQPKPSAGEIDATNFSGNPATNDPSDGKTIETTGAYPIDQSQFDKADYPSPTLRAEDPEP